MDQDSTAPAEQPNAIDSDSETTNPPTAPEVEQKSSADDGPTEASIEHSSQPEVKKNRKTPLAWIKPITLTIFLGVYTWKRGNLVKV